MLGGSGSWRGQAGARPSRTRWTASKLNAVPHGEGRGAGALAGLVPGYGIRGTRTGEGRRRDDSTCRPGRGRTLASRLAEARLGSPRARRGGGFRSARRGADGTRPETPDCPSGARDAGPRKQSGCNGRGRRGAGSLAAPRPAGGALCRALCPALALGLTGVPDRAWRDPRRCASCGVASRSGKGLM